jgi:glycerol uptake facilitator-like aquaporin
MKDALPQHRVRFQRLWIGGGVIAAAVFLITAWQAVARMGPTPDGTCATAPTCPNSHQWIALLVLAGLCVALAFLTLVAVWDGGPRRRQIAVALAIAAAVLVVNPPDHLNSPHADWFGRSLSDGSLN